MCTVYIVMLRIKEMTYLVKLQSVDVTDEDSAHLQNARRRNSFDSSRSNLMGVEQILVRRKTHLW